MRKNLHKLKLQTHKACEMIDITDQIQGLIYDADHRSGHAIVYVPHTTAGVTINENADPDVVHDVLEQLDQIAPHRQPFYQHAEGNSAAHVKSILTGNSVTVLIHDTRLILGCWQGIFFCEYDGPRQRELMVQLNTVSGP